MSTRTMEDPAPMQELDTELDELRERLALIRGHL
jgi:hypothetical protein